MTEQLTLISTKNIKKFLPINEKRHIKLEEKYKNFKTFIRSRNIYSQYTYEEM